MHLYFRAVIQILSIISVMLMMVSYIKVYIFRKKNDKESYYTPVHLVESVENCGLCMRRYLACSSYAKVMHQELAIMRALRYDASARD